MTKLEELREAEHKAHLARSEALAAEWEVKRLYANVAEQAINPELHFLISGKEMARIGRAIAHCVQVEHIMATTPSESETEANICQTAAA